MATPTGVINGTNCLLVKQMNNGSQKIIGALISNSNSFSRALIESTSKSSDEFREYMIGEGTKSADHSCECYFSDDAAFLEMRQAWTSGEIGRYLFVYDGAATDWFDFIVETDSETANLNEAVKASFSLKSSNQFELQKLFETLTTNDDINLSANDAEILAVKV